ncbi:hypothetical protein SAMN04489761_2585 [Tenacibaculum sp. MAR_2009_124]|uniref:hypothetical protein n=1 Tax=Tenacibaculum sp. MAR_2009_124 TaxID=1250059 RepID=UPI00089AA7B4|nr:hypothetical protein [Tenacibaculum sp. MAR_2009_124]SEC28850.1 hypothetical protein SAMN04489761_2585 [Tenacibaculum sp. MAR_2009_124]
MKSIRDYNQNEIIKDTSNIFGGTKIIPTETSVTGGCGDTLYDHDEDGKISNGDELCFNVCV